MIERSILRIDLFTLVFIINRYDRIVLVTLSVRESARMFTLNVWFHFAILYVISSLVQVGVL